MPAMHRSVTYWHRRWPTTWRQGYGCSIAMSRTDPGHNFSTMRVPLRSRVGTDVMRSTASSMEEIWSSMPIAQSDMSSAASSNSTAVSEKLRISCILRHNWLAITAMRNGLGERRQSKRVKSKLPSSTDHITKSANVLSKYASPRRRRARMW